MATRRQQPARPREGAADSCGERIRSLRARLARTLPEPRCELDFESPWQLLVATILSAQSTDKVVNKATPALFRAYPTPAALAAAPRARVEQLVRTTGFFRNKAKAIQGAARVLAERHAGQVPRELEALVELPGVARKTANLVLGTAFGLSTGIVVDTHVARVAQRLGLSSQADPVKIERELCALFPRRSWPQTGHRLLLHGRYVCLARKPRCSACPLAELCPAREAEPEGSWSARAAGERSLVASRGEGAA